MMAEDIHDLQQYDFITNHERLCLVQKRTYEKIILADPNNPVYEYEFQLQVEQQQGDIHARYEVTIDNDHNDMSIMTNFSMVDFLENQILGFSSNSLQVDQIKTTTTSEPVNDNGQGKQSPDFIEIKLDKVANRIMFEYMFDNGHRDLDIRIKVVLKNQFQMSMVNSRNFRFHADSHMYHENGCAMGQPDLVDIITKGFDRTTLEAHYGTRNTNVKDEDDQGMDVDGMEDELTFDDDEMRRFNVGNHRAGRATATGRRNLTKILHPHQKPTNIHEDDDFSGSNSRLAGNASARGDSWMGTLLGKRLLGFAQGIIEAPMKKLNLQENGLTKVKACLFIEFPNHPAFILLVDKGRTVKNVKAMMERTLTMYNYHPTSAAQMRLLYNGKVREDKARLLDFIDSNKNVARMAIVTSKPSIVAPFEDRRQNEGATNEQKAATSTLNSCRILLRNFEACNSNADYFRKPSDRVRFNTPVTKTQANVVSEDLGYFVKDVAKEVKRYAINLNRLANKMTQDRNMDRSSTEYEQYKSDIQNMMDAARYASPMFMNMAKFTLPLGHPSPRPISVLPRRGPRANQ